MLSSRRSLFIFLVVFAAALTLTTAASAGSKPKSKDFDYYVVGNSEDVQTSTTGGLALNGGPEGTDGAFSWMIARSGGGDFVVICATCNGYNNKTIYKLGTVDSVETLKIKNRAAASDPFVVDKIRNAEALFINGGDQSDYVNYWKGTPVEDAIHELVSRNVPIGGSSAGLAIMGEFLFSAQNGGLTSSQALANPYDLLITLDRDFLVLPNMNGIITDTHFAQRDRMGRLVAFLARLVQDGWVAPAKGIAVDEDTALLVEPDGSGSVVGPGSVYFLRTSNAPTVCEAGQPLTIQNVSVYRANGAATFDVPSWTGSGGTAYALSANAGVLTSTQPGGGIY